MEERDVSHRPSSTPGSPLAPPPQLAHQFRITSSSLVGSHGEIPKSPETREATKEKEADPFPRALISKRGILPRKQTESIRKSRKGGTLPSFLTRARKGSGGPPNRRRIQQDFASKSSIPASGDRMAEDAATRKVELPKVEDTPVSAAGKAKTQKRKGFLSRAWAWTFGGRQQDYESLLQHLSKEEADVHRRMKRRQQWWSSWARNIIVCGSVCEILAVAYAFVITRTEDLSWQKRALHVSPMFFLPALLYGIYTLLSSYTKMREKKDQRTLERLRAERQAKIDELKEKSNYYITQQLIQKYDLDPAAKAAAATVLATKLGAESGLKLRVGDEQKLHEASASSDVELVSTDGLRNRKQPTVRNHGTGTTNAHQLSVEAAGEIGPETEASAGQGHLYVEHYKGSAPSEGGWIARLAAMLVGEDPTQCYALICGNCHMHNGLARKEDFPYVTYYCPHCRALNGPRHAQGNVPGSVSGSGYSSSPAPGSADITPKAGTTGATVTDTVVDGTSPTVQEELQPSSTGSNEVPSGVQD